MYLSNNDFVFEIYISEEFELWKSTSAGGTHVNMEEHDYIYIILIVLIYFNEILFVKTMLVFFVLIHSDRKNYTL